MLRDWAITYKCLQLSGLSTLSYIFDFIFYSTILIFSTVLGRLVPPIYHEFSLFDISLRYTFLPQATVPVWLLILISAGIPLLQFLLCAIFFRSLSLKRRLWDFFAGCLCLLGAQATQVWAVSLLKNITGLPRPDMIERCEPMVQSIPFTQLSNVAICTQPNWNVVMEGFRSFPSGHASTVFCGMIITSLNMAAKLQTFDRRNNSFKVFLTIAPLLGAAFVAGTRVSDNRHFLRDVIAGSMLGSFVGASFYHQYHPSVFQLASRGRAFPPRRFCISRFFRNIGGFWSVDADEAFDEVNEAARTIENEDAERLIQESGHGTNVQVKTLADNIKIVNML
ncbi:hypothetical protein KGF57_001049 [Candida theae]|uniref:Phosphatidic acid phosphatase type 2/haloperoxidase domain-containing protein n=1 Tax=Candida theae TaxID=1198502 RepID=A0AAD5BI65_9ASCO|nr:uncharacterized protein KGF57_001049 [Candida theae]KAI5964557.1 hypothetical protein KGF57_001049 [Candida theae]